MDLRHIQLARMGTGDKRAVDNGDQGMVYRQDGLVVSGHEGHEPDLPVLAEVGQSPRADRNQKPLSSCLAVV